MLQVQKNFFPVIQKSFIEMYILTFNYQD